MDHAATEEPLEIRLHGRPFAVIMRTPGADRELAAGFLLAERVIRSADDLGTIEHCRNRQRRQDDQGEPGGNGENIVNVTLANGAATLDRVMADRRQVTTTSSCGLCGRRTIESLASEAAPIRASWRVPATTIASLPDLLRARQAGFDETGGLHAAGVFARGGAPAGVAADVGRP